MSYKRLTPCIFIDKERQLHGLTTVLFCQMMSALAKHYNEKGADELIVFDLSDSDEEHDESIELIKQINRVISIPDDRRR